ncbi:FoF1 ATP synthase subunit A [Sciscionella sediminilitoris]|uniref:FoF1 ATP synthase subunit A n=1 Tax=Sciscionella sediminilitoris TaxID=1445613 RepID=UPI0004DF9BEF|nr:FoF1 ATP synthase subunit a [Sciscionella sp. SE31]
MTSTLAADSQIQVGEYGQTEVLGITLNMTTILGTLVAAVILLAVGFFVRAKLVASANSGAKVPGGTQLFLETIVKHFRDQIQSFVGIKVAPFLVPVCLALFLFILSANWLTFLPLHHYLPPPSADVNFVYALALLMFIWWHAAGTRRHKGVGKHALHVLKGHYAPFAPMWVIEEVVHLLSLPLRLFGNMLAGGILIMLLGLLPAYFNWIPIAGWKLFDMAIGLLQAYLFVLLTISYFSQAMEVHDEEH